MSDRKVMGVGINDNGGPIPPEDKPIYNTWYRMLWECYGPECDGSRWVDEEWFRYSAFRDFWKRYHKPGTRMVCLDMIGTYYGASTCSFMSAADAALYRGPTNNGSLPPGVERRPGPKGTAYFVARMRFGGKTHRWGRFDTPGEAHRAYLIRRVKVLHHVAEERRLVNPPLWRGFHALADQIEYELGLDQRKAG